MFCNKKRKKRIKYTQVLDIMRKIWDYIYYSISCLKGRILQYNLANTWNQFLYRNVATGILSYVKLLTIMPSLTSCSHVQCDEVNIWTAKTAKFLFIELIVIYKAKNISAERLKTQLLQKKCLFETYALFMNKIKKRYWKKYMNTWREIYLILTWSIVAFIFTFIEVL